MKPTINTPFILSRDWDPLKPRTDAELRQQVERDAAQAMNIYASSGRATYDAVLEVMLCLEQKHLDETRRKIVIIEELRARESKGGNQ